MTYYESWFINTNLNISYNYKLKAYVVMIMFVNISISMTYIMTSFVGFILNTSILATTTFKGTYKIIYTLSTSLSVNISLLGRKMVTMLLSTNLFINNMYIKLRRRQNIAININLDSRMLLQGTNFVEFILSLNLITSINNKTKYYKRLIVNTLMNVWLNAGGRTFYQLIEVATSLIVSLKNKIKCKNNGKIRL